VVNLEATFEGLDIKVFLPDVVEVEVGGHDDLLGANRAHLAKLVLCHEGLLLADLLQHTKHEGLILFEVINENNLLVGVAVPVLRLVLLVAVRVPLEYPVGLAGAGLAIDPLVVHRSTVGLVGAGLEEVNSRLDPGVVLDGDRAFLESLLSAHRDELLVLAGSVTLDIKLGRLDPKGPRSIYTGLLLVAVVVGTVVELDSRKVGLLAVGFQVSEALLLPELNEELDVRGATFLKLAGNKDCISLGVPGLKV